jgi:hypothetical protein
MAQGKLCRRSTISGSNNGSQGGKSQARFQNASALLINNLQHEMDKRSKVASEASGAPATFESTSLGGATDGQRSYQPHPKQIQFNIKRMSRDRSGLLGKQFKTQATTMVQT